VLDVVAENAARLCHATNAVIYRVEGDYTRLVAAYEGAPDIGLPFPLGSTMPLTVRSVTSRAIVERRTIHPGAHRAARRADLGEERGGEGIDVHVHAAGALWRMRRPRKNAGGG
jgi:hypothetical protein